MTDRQAIEDLFDKYRGFKIQYSICVFGDRVPRRRHRRPRIQKKWIKRFGFRWRPDFYMPLNPGDPCPAKIRGLRVTSVVLDTRTIRVGPAAALPVIPIRVQQRGFGAVEIKAIDIEFDAYATRQMIPPELYNDAPAAVARMIGEIRSRMRKAVVDRAMMKLSETIPADPGNPI